jgi:UDP-glucuronate 4-epimerase
MKKILVTGGAGFIGSHLCERLLAFGHKVVCLDNFESFYPRHTKEQNLSTSLKYKNFQLIEGSINDIEDFAPQIGDVNVIVHLAARAGVRPSIEKPIGYYETNVLGTMHMLEFARKHGVHKFINASSSSVYGINRNTPWREDDLDLQPISPYAASKVAAEKACFTYAHLYDIKITSLRFFTVFGPRQRPDLAIHKFTKAVLEGREIDIYGDGSTSRDYTYVDDIISGIISALDYEKKGHTVFNLGNRQTVELTNLIRAIESACNREALKLFQPMQAGDVEITNADIDKARSELGYDPQTPLLTGIKNFVTWLNQP